MLDLLTLHGKATAAGVDLDKLNLAGGIHDSRPGSRHATETTGRVPGYED